MITLVSGEAVGRMLGRVTSAPWNYSQILICSPFIDRDLVPQLHELCEAAERSRCAVTIVTKRSRTDFLEALCSGRRYVRLFIRERLHTKAYVVRTRNRSCGSEALVTSANLTRAGLTTNHELGVHIRCTSDCGRHLFRQLDRSLRRLTSEKV